MCDVTHGLTPSPCHKLSHFLKPPLPLERDVLYGRPPSGSASQTFQCHGPAGINFQCHGPAEIFHCRRTGAKFISYLSFSFLITKIPKKMILMHACLVNYMTLLAFK